MVQRYTFIGSITPNCVYFYFHSKQLQNTYKNQSYFPTKVQNKIEDNPF